MIIIYFPRYVKLYGETITNFLVEDFCATTEDEDCAHHGADHYVDTFVSRRKYMSNTILSIKYYRMLSSTIL